MIAIFVSRRRPAEKNAFGWLQRADFHIAVEFEVDFLFFEV